MSFKIKYKNYRSDLNLWEELRIYRDYIETIKLYVYTLNSWEFHRVHKLIYNRTKKYITKAYIHKKTELVQGIDYNIVAGEFKLI